MLIMNQNFKTDHGDLRKNGVDSMFRLLILADDFTGALDSGVQLAKCGAHTHVTTNLNLSFEPWKEDARNSVVVVDTESRHLEPRRAFEIVCGIARRAAKAGVPVIYKKTDSALRGNVGAELEGVLEGSGARRLVFVPAYPKLNQLTRGGVQYIDGVPVKESVFGRDPFEPVTESSVSAIIGRQSGVPVVPLAEGASLPQPTGRMEILLCDVSSDRACAEIAGRLGEMKPVTVLAGCAGFAEYLPRLLHLHQPLPPLTVTDKGLLVVSGSLNPITAAQLDHARRRGFDAWRLTSEQMQRGIPAGAEGDAAVEGIAALYGRKKRLLLYGEAPGEGWERSGFEEKSRDVARHMGELVRRLYLRGVRGVFMVMGGDTLSGVLASMECTRMRPLCEIEPGVVLSRAELPEGSMMIVSKSGGMGSKEAFVNAARFIEEHYGASE